MIYAKCIHEEQIAHSVEEFLSRQSEDNCVYCENQVTRSKYGQNTLYCVPLNLIYDCLKYGNYIAIIEVESFEGDSDSGSYLNKQLAMSEQKVVKIFNAYSKVGIDYVFDHVKDPNLVHCGYVHWLPEELKNYFEKRKKKQNI